MLRFHVIEPPQIALEEPEVKKLKLMARLQQQQTEFRLLLKRCGARRPEPDEKTLKELPGKLIKFLEDAEREHWTVEPDDSLNYSLEDYWREADGVPHRMASEPATDSPPSKPSLFSLGQPKRGAKRPLTAN
jgi:hypothetical protein